MFVLFSIISGKQLYYPLPEFGGGMLLLAGAIALLRERRVALSENYWLGSWPLGIGGILFAGFLFALPYLVASNRLHGEWFDGAAPYSRTFSMAFLLLGCLLLLRGRGEMRRVAVAGLFGVLALNTLFTLTLWHKYDLTPASTFLSAAESDHHVIAIEGNYEGQFHFAGRLSQPITELRNGQALQEFAKSHPDGLIITHPEDLQASALRYALLVQPFRSSWVVVWSAPILADLRAGRTPTEPLQPPQIFPAAKVQYGGQTVNAALIAGLRAQCGGPRDGALLRFSLGNALLDQGDHTAAAEELRRALSFDPSYSAAWETAGQGLPRRRRHRWRRRSVATRHRGCATAWRQAGGEGNGRVFAQDRKERRVTPAAHQYGLGRLSAEYRL